MDLACIVCNAARDNNLNLLKVSAQRKEAIYKNKKKSKTLILLLFAMREEEQRRKRASKQKNVQVLQSLPQPYPQYNYIPTCFLDEQNSLFMVLCMSVCRQRDWICFFLILYL